MSDNKKHNYPFQYPGKILIAVAILILVSLSCNMPTAAKKSGDQQQPGRIETSIASTMIALGREGDSDQVDQAEPDEQAALPTDTFTPEFTETPSLTPTVTETPTPEVAMVYASENTNCRTGPNTYFDWLFTLEQGESAEAVAKGPYGNYWYIKQPGQPSTICALWGKYATPSGPYEALPEWTPIPTPTPKGMDFTISYHVDINCGFFWALQYRIDNKGSKKIESWKITVTDHTGGSNPGDSEDNEFYDYSGCDEQGVQVDLTPGEAYYVYALFANDPHGHDITIKVKMCSKNSLGGECETKKYRHTP